MRRLLLLMTACLLCGCGNRGAVAPAIPTGNAISTPLPASIHVQVLPEQPLTHDPFELAAPMNPSPVPDRSVSELLTALEGSAYLDSEIRNRVARSGSAAEFTPDWQGGSLTQVAYAVYRFSLTGYSGDASLGFAWSETAFPAHTELFVAFSNYQRGRWEWFGGPDDGVLTVAGFMPYTNSSDQMYVVVALTGTSASRLEGLALGAPEERGLGALPLTNPPVTVPPLAGSSLPSAVDLSPDCSPVRHQGNIGSCASFAVNAGAYEYELGRLYGAGGWDLTSNGFRCSPRWLHIKSALDQGLPPCDRNTGRGIHKVLELLSTQGTATEANAFYGYVFFDRVFGFKCQDQWSVDALADAAVLNIESFSALPYTGQEGVAQAEVIDSIKSTLHHQRRPVVMQCQLDQDFGNIGPDNPVWSFNPARAWPAPGSHHAMLIVGYNNNKSGGAFKVRNSWGVGWGVEGGHCWISYSTFLNQQAQAYCWVLADEYDPAVAQRFLGAGVPALAPPVNFAASQGTDHLQVNLSWQPVAGATGYRIYRGGKNSWDEVVVLNTGSAAQWSDTTAQTGVCYPYWIRAFNTTSSSELSACALGWRGEADGWLRTWGGADDYDYAYGVAVDSQGNVLVSGESRSYGAGGYDLTVLKLSPDGNLLWQRCFGTSNHERGFAIACDADDNVYVAGVFEEGSFTNYRGLVVKLAPDGEPQWAKAWRGDPSAPWRVSKFTGIVLDANGNIHCIGSLSRDAPDAPNNGWALVKFSSSGAHQWSTCWYGSDRGEPSALAFDGTGFIAAGRTSNGTVGGDDAAYVRFSSSGAVQWQKEWSTPQQTISGADYLKGVWCDPLNGCAYTCGYTNGFGQGDLLLLKFALNTGELLWQRSWGIGYDDIGYYVSGKVDGSVAFVGKGTSGVVYDELLLLTLAANGSVLGAERLRSQSHTAGYGVTALGNSVLAVGSTGDLDGLEWRSADGSLLIPTVALSDLPADSETLLPAVENAAGAWFFPNGVLNPDSGWTDQLILRRD